MRRLLTLILVGIELMVVFVITTNVIVLLSTRRYIYNDVNSVPSAQAVLIPGASLLPDGTPAPIFKDRVNAAIDLYAAGKAEKFLVSGDNGEESHNEVDPVRLYLLEKGVPAQDIFLDHAGFDTYSTMYRARRVFGVSSVIIATQSFHLPRAIFLARKLGISAYGINADEGHILFDNYVREIFANEKAIIDLAVNRKPKYLGEAIPITDGDRR